ncbi:MAG: 2-hydroxychromene-2-carboxylate isomerase [Deltaproteobacteria bacterium]|nr:2-hydroxychromene-2-carboxylate isomerase [Deltaproteobacteria bacterium]
MANEATKPTQVHFWFEFASTYSYLASSRIGEIGKAANTEIVWEPFLLGPIFKEQGWRDSPFNLYPQKGRYMWRDMERLCENYGLPFRRPEKFPANSLIATRVAMSGHGEAWLPDFARAVYHANFATGGDISDPELIADILSAVAQPAEELIERANRDDTKKLLREQTDRAAKLGIFGAPTFVVGDELFWGNDRMGDAIVWARTGGNS